MTALSPEPGRIALVRQRRYLVENVTPSPSPDEAMLVDLSCLDDDAQGESPSRFVGVINTTLEIV